MDLEELKICSEQDFTDLKVLMNELSPKIILGRESLERMLSDADSHLFVIRDGGRIVASASLCIFHQPFETDGTVEAVVVSSGCRGRGLGRVLMEGVLREARKYSPIVLHLTSNPSRTAANRLYPELGFRRKETNVYIMEL